jgi:hypothetical protein
LILGPPLKFFRAKSKQAGKKKRGSGGNEFLPACSVPRSGTGGGKRLVLALARKQSQKKLFLFRRIFCARPLKELIIFSGFACSAYGGVSRWAGYAPVRAQTFAQIWFEQGSAIATKLNFFQIVRKVCARFARALGAFFPYFPPKSAILPSSSKRLFCPAGGGSWWRSHLSKNISLKELLKCFCFPIFPPLAEGKRTRQVLIPRFTLRQRRSGQRRPI